MLISVLQYLAPDGLNIDQLIRQVLEETKASFENISSGKAPPEPVRAAGDTKTPGELFFFYWQGLMALLLLGFVLSCVSVVAQYYQLILDSAISDKLRNRLPKAVRDEITSPKSGRLNLPPPTPAALRKAKQR
jgi:hypothetical protein